jgi:hypothetical protein
MGGEGGEKCQKRTKNGLALSLLRSICRPIVRTVSLSPSIFFHSSYSFANHIQQLFKLKREEGKKKKNERVCARVR